MPTFSQILLAEDDDRKETNASQERDKQAAEKDALAQKQSQDLAAAQEKDIKDKQREKEQALRDKQAERDQKKVANESLDALFEEALEIGTDELLAAYQAVFPEQAKWCGQIAEGSIGKKYGFSADSKNPNILVAGVGQMKLNQLKQHVSGYVSDMMEACKAEEWEKVKHNLVSGTLLHYVQALIDIEQEMS